MSGKQIVLNTGFWTVEGEDPAAGMKAYTKWRDQLVAEKGTQFYEDYANGIVDINGNLTEEAIRAEQEFEDYWADRDDRYHRSNSLC